MSGIIDQNNICLTNLGRNLDIPTTIKHKIKTADRLIGNKKLHLERRTIYQALSKQLLNTIPNPIIIIDWSPLSSDQEQQLLRAAFALNGKRSIALYEEVHPVHLLGNRDIQTQFLDRLKYQILPKHIQPIIIADSGFRVPFFKQVETLGWHWLGRIRNRDFIACTPSNLDDNKPRFFKAKDLYPNATTTPQAIGEILWTKSSKFEANLFLYHKAAQRRLDKTVKGQRRQDKYSRKHALREREPWLLVASKSLDINAQQAVDYYTSRMQVETGFRDMKSPYYGLGLTDNSRILPCRYENLLVIVALASYLLWIIGNGIQGKKNT